MICSNLIWPYVERCVGVKLEATEKLYAHPNRSYNGTEIMG